MRVPTTELDLEGRKTNLSVIDTEGFGDAINNTKSYVRRPGHDLGRDRCEPRSPAPPRMHSHSRTSVETVLNYVQDQFRAFLAEESRVKRSAKFLDPRVHVILYFIAPTGHGYGRVGGSAGHGVVVRLHAHARPRAGARRCAA